MTAIRTSSQTASYTSRSITSALLLALIGISALYILSTPSKIATKPQQPSKQQLKVEPHSVHSMMAQHKSAIATTNEEEHDPMKLFSSSISSIPYYHCGPHPDESTSELLLLHGAAFTKEDWKSSGILEKLCDLNNDEEGGDLTVTALDLPVSATGEELASIYDALVDKGVLSGRPVVVVTPSASGKAVVSLSSDREKLQRIVKGWIPIAPPAVGQAADDAFENFNELSIPILAIYGNQDDMGKKVTEKLVKLVGEGVKAVELEGRHPVYLDSPDEFVQEVLQFLEEEQL
jgi:pimeloyl-ACP methyl ester carboxylesterase